ncbi:methyltransferase domain-containing protein [Rubrobacter taiwanensis]|uniref:tRNA (guanine-N(7)-)-methyltransferase n=1 Tax=Rubrobacter taiwanensis TaxID=185139 RepID=A0A4R1BCN1_9ACTN|nr:methyltransferase domain-containing protein [Rubrobacter taiwanensis]TCJ14815.1 methyltransferase domain-containing protein [Rubrobacter taiwanensis]
MARRKLGRMKVRRPGAGVAARYLRVFPGRRLYYEPESLPRITSEELFGDGKPLELEAGCGTGDFLNALAERDPGANFVGVDLHMKSLYRAVNRAAERELENVLYISADFNIIYPLLEDVSLRAVYLHFPDPGMKPRQEKNRIFRRRFLDELHRALVPGGRISVMTDHDGYYEQMLSLLSGDERWEKCFGELSVDPGVKSRFHRLWEDEYGRTTHRFELVKI